MLESLAMAEWSSGKKTAAARRPEGPQSFEQFTPSEDSRWKLVPFSAQGGFEDWPALDELFVTKLQGVNPNRGLDGSIVDIDRAALISRMRDYFSNMTPERLRERHPVLMQNRARYDATEVRKKLKAGVGFNEDKVLPYVVFPLDQRWLYYETENKFLNEARADLYANLKDNEFLVTVPEPRKESETRPILLTTAFDLHLHDRGSVSFPVEVVAGESMAGTLFASHASTRHRQSNLAASVWKCLKQAFALKGDLSGNDARSTARGVARVSLAICHAPQYQSEHKESLAQDWAHIPIPKSRELFDELIEAGETLGILLDPVSAPVKRLKAMLGDEMKHLAVPSKIGGGDVNQDELSVEYSFFGGAQGGWRSRPNSSNEPLYEEWGGVTGDLYINDTVYFRHVPERIWRYELGGYPVIKKWLGYRDRGRRPGVMLSMQEVTHLRGMVHRIAAILRLHIHLDNLYERACQDCFSGESLGI
jgi:hypothetical protein